MWAVPTTTQPFWGETLPGASAAVSARRAPSGPARLQASEYEDVIVDYIIS